MVLRQHVSALVSDSLLAVVPGGDSVAGLLAAACIRRPVRIVDTCTDGVVIQLLLLLLACSFLPPIIVRGTGGGGSDRWSCSSGGEGKVPACRSSPMIACVTSLTIEAFDVLRHLYAARSCRIASLSWSGMRAHSSDEKLYDAWILIVPPSTVLVVLASG